MRILITGASDGIGGAAALRLAEDRQRAGGAARIVLANSGRRPLPPALLEALAGFGAEVHHVAADLADVEAARGLARAALERLGGMDCFVSNAGAMAGGPLKDLDVAAWDRLFDVNLRPTLVIAQELYPALRDGGGTIVATSSMTGELPLPSGGAYSASKAALSMLIRQMAQEWGPDGIRANAVAPGMIRTSLTERTYQDEAIHRGRRDLVPLRRIGTAEEIGNVIAFLAGPQSAYVNGQVLVADGGFVSAMLGQMPMPAPG